MVEPKRPNDIDLIVGANIRSRRTALGISQEKLGEQLGITFQQVQKYEKGTNRVSASKLFAIAKILGCTVQYLFKGIEDLGTEGDAETVAEGTARTREELRLLLNYRKLPWNARKSLNTMIHYMAQGTPEDAAAA